MQIYISKTYIDTYHIYYRECDVGQSRENKRKRDEPEESAPRGCLELVPRKKLRHQHLRR